MVVDQHAGEGRTADQGPKHVARVHLDAAHGAAGDLDLVDDATANIEGERHEDLLLEAAETGVHAANDVLGTANASRALTALFHGAAAELKARNQTSSARVTDATDDSQLGGRCASEHRQGATVSQ
jgi:hypothetical protein